MCFLFAGGLKQGMLGGEGKRNAASVEHAKKKED